jgi:hypothetical protein
MGDAFGVEILKQVSHEQGVLNPDLVQLEDELNEEMEEREEMFVGRRSEMERERWNPLNDIQEGRFIIINPDDGWEQINGKGKFWLVKAIGGVDPNHPSDEGPKPMFSIEWWRPKHISSSVDDKGRYLKCFSSTQGWERDPGYEEGAEIWQLATSAMYGWSSRMRADNIAKTGLKIPKLVIKNVRAYINMLT